MCEARPELGGRPLDPPKALPERQDAGARHMRIAQSAFAGRGGAFHGETKLFGAMKPGSNSKRSRGRGNPRRPNNGPRTQVFESNGPDTRIRGTVNQVLEKYLALARDASSSGDYVSAENYFQHAEHYFRILSANGGAHGGLQRIPGQPGQGPAPQHAQHPQHPQQRQPGEQGRPQGQPQHQPQHQPQAGHGAGQPQGGNGSSTPAAAPEDEEADFEASGPTTVSG